MPPEPTYYCSLAALHEMLESPVIDESRKSNIRLEIANRTGTLNSNTTNDEETS